MTNIIDRDDDKPYCFGGTIDYGDMIGCDGPDCETEWFYFACVEIDPRTKPEGSRFCESCRLKKKPKDWEEGWWSCVEGGGGNRSGGGGGKMNASGGARRDGRV